MKVSPGRYAQAKLELLTHPAIGVRQIYRALENAGLRTAFDATLRMVLTPDLADPELVIVQRETFAAGKQLLVVEPGSSAGSFVAGVFARGARPCWRCLAHRLAVNGWLAGKERRAGRHSALACGLAANWAAEHLAGRKTTRRPQMLELDRKGAITRRHTVIPWSGCPECASATRGPQPPFEALVSPLMGIVTDPEISQAGPRFFVAHAECSRQVYTLASGNRFTGRRLTIAGKGSTAREAQTRCIWEGIERSSLLFDGTEKRIKARFRDIGYTAIDPREMLLFSEAQYRRRTRWNRRHTACNWVPEPFDPEAEVEWAPVKPLGGGAARYVLAEACYLGYGGTYAWAESNGCAAGTTLPEAINRGLAELIERDAVAIWWYNRLSRPPVDPGALGTPRIRRLLAGLNEMKRNWWLLDVSADLLLPVFVAISTDEAGRRIALGSAAGWDLKQAAWGALAEMAAHVYELTALEAAMAAGAGESNPLWAWWSSASIAGHPYLIPAAGETLPKPAPVPATATRLSRRTGLRVYIQDLTRPDIGRPVVRVIAPGLRHWWARFGPGRLFEVPVQMGWKKRVLTEKELNPIAYFL